MLSIVPINYADYMKHGDAKIDRRPPKPKRPKAAK
jgi:hypothetical protein